MVPCSTLDGIRDGRYVWLAGIILVRQRPGSAKGVMFITIEDETGFANPIVWPRMFEENRRIVMGARLLGICGQVEREGEVVHVIVKKLVNLSDVLDTLTQRDASFCLAMGRADGAISGGEPDPRAGKGRAQVPAPNSSKAAIFIEAVGVGNGSTPQDYDESSCARIARRGASLSARPRQTIPS